MFVYATIKLHVKCIDRCKISCHFLCHFTLVRLNDLMFIDLLFPACPANCAYCTHDDGCTTCYTGYYLRADKTCSSKFEL